MKVRTNVFRNGLLALVAVAAAFALFSSVAVEPVAGHSLLDLVTGSQSDWEHPVFAENLAEGATTALLMVKQGHHKYVYSAVDPEQLFDLASDPLEQTNQAENPEYAEIKSQLAGLIEQTWDAQALSEKILHSQRRRLFLREALGEEISGEWEFAPEDELEQHCLRADRIYSKWAYDDILGFQVPKK